PPDRRVDAYPALMSASAAVRHLRPVLKWGSTAGLASPAPVLSHGAMVAHALCRSDRGAIATEATARYSWRAEAMPITYDAPQTRRRFLVAILGGAAAAMLIGAPESADASTAEERRQRRASPSTAAARKTKQRRSRRKRRREKM